MDAILSSKLYAVSRRKDKIASALNNPINQELVQQLRTYLTDEEDKQIASTPEPVKEPTVVDNNTETGDANIVKKPERNTSFTSRPATKPSPEVPESVEEPTENTEEIPLDKFHAPAEPEEDKELKDEDKVEESTTIEATTNVYPPSIENQIPIAQVDTETIKGTLNVRDDTKGVSRMFIRDNELWIYYQDKVNLNSVMEPVIAVLNATGYTNLEFNRLARTENAIVFEITCVKNPIDFITEPKEEK